MWYFLPYFWRTTSLFDQFFYVQLMFLFIFKVSRDSGIVQWTRNQFTSLLNLKRRHFLVGLFIVLLLYPCIFCNYSLLLYFLWQFIILFSYSCSSSLLFIVISSNPWILCDMGNSFCSILFIVLSSNPWIRCDIDNSFFSILFIILSSNPWIRYGQGW